MLHQAKQSNLPKCAACGALASWDVWELPICVACHGEWIRDERFSAGTINAALGLGNTPEEFTEAGHQRYCAEATKRTRAWVAERRTARAA